MIARLTLPRGFAPGIVLMFTATPANASPASGTDPIGMFLGADPVVKSVMLVLVLASFMCWALCVVKAREITRGIRSVTMATHRLHDAEYLQSLVGLHGDVQRMVDAAEDEIRRSHALIRQGRVDGVGARVENRVARIEDAAFASMRRGIPFFASVGSVGPFIGLFGTVWGIMHSFASISGAQSSSLAVVAPGISEALLATALGLVAAIPATIMYNYLLRRLATYRATLQTGATMLIGLTAREVEAMAPASRMRDAA